MATATGDFPLTWRSDEADSDALEPGACAGSLPVPKMIVDAVKAGKRVTAEIAGGQITWSIDGEWACVHSPEQIF